MYNSTKFTLNKGYTKRTFNFDVCSEMAKEPHCWNTHAMYAFEDVYSFRHANSFGLHFILIIIWHAILILSNQEKCKSAGL